MKETVDILISEKAIAKRVEELSEEIHRDYINKDIYMLCILKGGVIFMVDLARKLPGNVELAFMDVSSYYSETKTSGEIVVNMDMKEDISDKHVLIVEDVVDSGRTLNFLIRHINKKNPASVRICTLLDKPEQRDVHVEIDYIGFTIPDVFVVGYGLDYNQRYRNLKYIGSLKFDLY